MNRRVFTGSALAFACLPGLRGQQAGASLQMDVNSVYQTVLHLQCLCCDDRRAAVLIQSTPILPGFPHINTSTLTPLQKAMQGAKEGSTLGPPPDRLNDALGLISDLRTVCAQPLHPLDRGLSIPIPHVFISQQEERQFFVLNPQGGVYDPAVVRQAHSVPKALQRRFAHATTVWSLSSVAFNQQRTLALVLFRSMGGGCMSEAWNVFERSDASWQKLPWDNFANNYST